MSLDDFLAVIGRSSSFLLASHLEPEGDAIGSQLALGFLLEAMGREVILVNQDPVPLDYEFLPGAERFHTSVPEGVTYDVSVVLDCPSLDRVGSVESLVRNADTIVNIDHHVGNEVFGNVNIVDTEAAAVGEIVYEVYRKTGIKPTLDSAMAMYTAILTDTGSFRYSSTTSRTFEIAAALLRTGLEPGDLWARIYERRSLARVQLLGHVLSTLKASPDGRIAWLEVTQDMLNRCGAGREDTHDMINFAREIDRVQAAVLFRDEGDKVKVSLRSKGDLDVQSIASSFGGGGHRNAAGCTLEMPLSQAETAVLQTLQKALDAGG